MRRDDMSKSKRSNLAWSVSMLPPCTMVHVIHLVFITLFTCDMFASIFFLSYFLHLISLF